MFTVAVTSQQSMVIAPDFDPRPVVSLRHVWKTYPNGADALKDVSLTILEGDFVFLVGPSGAGKTTVVRLLIREERATRGLVLVRGQDLGRLTRRRLPHLRRAIGLVFQDFKLLPRLTAHENVGLALRALGESPRRIEERVGEVLDMVGLGALGGKYPGELSGGEQQRVAIARALAHRPRLVIADEPTGNLDPATAWDIMQLLLRINRETGATVVMATHNREIVDLMRRRVVAIERGRVVRDDRAARYHEDLETPALRVR